MTRYIASALIALAMAGCAVKSNPDGGYNVRPLWGSSAEPKKPPPPDPLAAVQAPAPAPKPAVPTAPAAPAAKPAAPAAPTLGAELPLTAFPSSKNAAMGSPWTVMGAYPFTGTLDQAIRGMKIPDAKKALFKELFTGGKCQRYELKDGERFTLDGLNFSVAGDHRVRGNVAADLKKLPSKMVTICHLGEGLYAGQFDGCKNFWWSYSSPPQRRQVAPPPPAAAAPPPPPRVSATPNACPSEDRVFYEHFFRRASEHAEVERAYLAAKPTFGGAEAFSRSRNGLITILVPEERAKHRLWRATVPIAVVVETIDSGGKVIERLAEHTMERGEKMITLPYAKIAGKTVRFVHTIPGDRAEINSPVKSADGLYEIHVLPKEFETPNCRYDVGGVVTEKAAAPAAAK